MTEITLHPDYRPLPAQRTFHDAGFTPITPGAAPGGIRYRAYVGGIGSGKSLANVVEVLRFLATYPGSAGIIASPTLQQLKKSILVEFLEQCRKSDGFLVNYNRSDHVAEFINGSRLYFGHANEPDSLRGANLAVFGFDEAGQVLDGGEAFRILQGRIRDPRFPNCGFITTTPRGKSWLYDYFVMKRDQNGEPLINPDDYTMIQCRTEDNIHLDPIYAASLRASYSGEFARQELDGSFVSFEGLVFPGLSSQLGVMPADSIARRVCGLDWGYTNAAAVIVAGQDRNNRIGILEESFTTQTPLETSDGTRSLVDIVKELKTRHRFDVVYCDPSAPAVISTLNRHGIHAVAADNAVLPGISAVAAAQANGMIIDPDCVELCKELDAYEWAKGRDGKIRQDTVNKVNDHGVDSVRYICSALTKSVTAVPRVAPIKMRRPR